MGKEKLRLYVTLFRNADGLDGELGKLIVTIPGTTAKLSV
jgi:hypothetical protein